MRRTRIMLRIIGQEDRETNERGKPLDRKGPIMTDEQKKDFQDMDGIFEVGDEDLENIAGGLVYHDKGDPTAHRREAYYVLNNDGDIIMRLDDLGKAKHWAKNLREDQRLINTDEFERLRRK